jgi:DNA-binding NarL/FixJ family response regulator
MHDEKRGAAKKSRADEAEKEILALVRAGVERFILKNASVEDFYKTIQAVTDKEKNYSHQLTRSVFARIVKQAIRKRKQRRST